MVSIILMQIIMVALPILIIAYTSQPSLKIFALQIAATNNQTLKNTTHTVDNMTTNINNTAQFRRSDNVGTKLEPSELYPPSLSEGNTSKAPLSNPQMVITLLNSMTVDDISKFPLKNISTDELITVFNGLSVQVLFKTLENIPAADLADIFNKLPQDKSQGILSRLPSAQSQEILGRLTGEQTK